MKDIERIQSEISELTTQFNLWKEDFKVFENRLNALRNYIVNERNIESLKKHNK